MLFLVYRERDRPWTIEAITRELRSSEPLIRDVVDRLERGALVARAPDGTIRYAPADALLDALVVRLDRVRIERPQALVREIYGAPNEKLRTFSNAFKLKKD